MTVTRAARKRQIINYLSRFPVSLLACFLCLPALALNPDWKLTQYAHSAWRVQDGVFNGSPEAITQTNDGYIWIGTSSGLLRFDGVRFVPGISTGDERLASASIEALLGANDGSLWIGSREADGVWRWKDGRLTRIQLPPYYQTHSPDTSNIVEKSDGSVWATESALSGGQRSPLCQVDAEPVRCYSKVEGTFFDYGGALASDAQGNLWIGSLGRTEVVRWKPKAATVYHAPSIFRPDIPSINISGIVIAPDGSAWVGFDEPGPRRGLQRLANGVWQPFRALGWDGNALAVEAMYLDRHSTLWIGTIKNGLYRLRDGAVEHLGTAEGLTGNYVRKILEDKEGDLWVITDEGVDCFRQLKIASYSQREGLEPAGLVSVVATKDGTIWAGGDRALDALRGRQIRSFKTGRGLPGSQVTSLLENRQGRLWVGIDNTLWLYQRERFVPVRGRGGQPVGFVTDLAEDVDGDLWATIRAEPRRLLRIRDLQVQEEFAPPQVPAARKVAADPHGGIWLGLLSGDLARYRSGRVEVFHFPHTPETYVKQLEVRPGGAVLGTTAFGLLGWHQGRQQVMTTRNGLPCDSIYTSITDARGDLWLYTQCGLVQIAGEELARWWGHPEVVLHRRVFDAADGTHPQSVPFKSSTRSPDGKLWFAMHSDLQVIDPAHMPLNTVPPPVHIEEITADQHRYFVASGLRLPPRTRNLVLRYTALSFVAPLKVRFRYKLEGQDTDWQDAGTRREAFYTNLAPGSYRFWVKACNNDGLWNEGGATWSFQIAPAFHQTWWFRLFCLLLALALGWLLYWLRLQQVTLQIQARLQGMLSERERIARDLHDTLLQNVQGLILSVQAASDQLLPEHPTRKFMETALDHADQTLRQARERVRELRDPVETPDDLGQFFTQVASWAQSDTGIEFNVLIEGTPRRLHKLVWEEVKAIGREALLNAFRHSGGQRIEVEITYLRDAIQLRFCDNGQGIEPTVLAEGKPLHWGLIGMRERAQSIGGHLNVYSKPSVGTEIELSIPAPVAYRTAK